MNHCSGDFSLEEFTNILISQSLERYESPDTSHFSLTFALTQSLKPVERHATGCGIRRDHRFRGSLEVNSERFKSVQTAQLITNIYSTELFKVRQALSGLEISTRFHLQP